MNDDREEFLNLDMDLYTIQSEAVKKLDDSRYWVVYRVEKKQGATNENHK